VFSFGAVEDEDLMRETAIRALNAAKQDKHTSSRILERCFALRAMFWRKIDSVGQDYEGSISFGRLAGWRNSDGKNGKLRLESEDRRAERMAGVNLTP
jgi:hypothetical protein